MFKRMHLRKVLTTVGLASLLCWPSLVLSESTWAKEENQQESEGFPTNRRGITFRGKPNQDNRDSSGQEGLPARRVGGGSRDLLSWDPLIALIPEEGPVKTEEAFPLLYFYLPQVKPSQEVKIEFVLYTEQEWRQYKKEAKPIYEKIFSTTDREGILSLKMLASDTFEGLSVGKNYHWFLSIISDRDRARDQVVKGWIRRVEADPALNSQLVKATPLERVKLLQEAGLWHEAVHILAELKRSRPEDAEIADKWEQLLQSLTLEQLAQKPLIDANLQ